MISLSEQHLRANLCLSKCLLLMLFFVVQQNLIIKRETLTLLPPDTQGKLLPGRKQPRLHPRVFLSRDSEKSYHGYQRFFLVCDGELRFVGRRPKTRAAKPRGSLFKT